jgi:hypothetical protein
LCFANTIFFLCCFLPPAAGEAGLELVENMDKYVSGFISGFERRYSKLERAITTTISRTVLASPHRKRAAASAAAAKGKQPAQQHPRKKAGAQAVAAA